MYGWTGKILRLIDPQNISIEKPDVNFYQFFLAVGIIAYYLLSELLRVSTRSDQKMS
jgi:hypothetical protein